VLRARLFGRNEETASAALPSPSRLRRERRSLLRAREELLRDLGGLMLEMVRRDQFRQDLLLERCAELTELDARLAELDGLLAVSFSLRRTPTARCTCGTPILSGSSFCPRCGRPVAGEDA
jgi:hypothetical protein